MAGIDKIYGTQDQWRELREWLKKYKPEYLKQVSTIFYIQEYDIKNDSGPISNFTKAADKWLFENCSLQWVVDSIRKKYSGDPRDK